MASRRGTRTPGEVHRAGLISSYEVRSSINFLWRSAINGPTTHTNDPNHWRDRAAQKQALALTMEDPEIVILMNDLADDYDRLWLTERPTEESHPHKKANRARGAGEQSGG